MEERKGLYRRLLSLPPGVPARAVPIFLGEIAMAENTEPYRCSVCGYIYEPGRGEPGQKIPPGTAFEDLPADYVCPVCGAGSRSFLLLAERAGRYLCVACGYIYEPERGEPKNGIPPGTAFRDLPESYICPVCGAYAKVGKQAFIAID
jgi:rubredoxin